MSKLLLALLLVVPLSQVHSSELSYPERMYAEGGRNAWVKYLAYCRLNPEECMPEEMEKVKSYFSTLLVVPAEKEAVPEVKAEAIAKPVVVSKVLSKKIPSPIRPADPAKLVKEAERARTQGQLETALRYYRLAEKMNPEKEEFSQPIQELEKLME